MRKERKSASADTTQLPKSEEPTVRHVLSGRRGHIQINTNSCENLVLAVYMQAIQDYGICLRAKAKGKERLNQFGYIDQEMERLEAFFHEALGYVWATKLIEKIKSEAPKENRGSSWPRKQKGESEKREK